MEKRVIAKADIEALAARGQTTLQLQPGDMLTPLAREAALERGVTIYEPGAPLPAAAPAAPTAEGGVTMDEKVEQIVKAVLARLGEEVEKKGVCPPCATPKVYGTRPGAVTLFEIAKGKELPPFELRDSAGNLVTPPEIDFRLEDVVTVEHGSTMGVGFMSWIKGGFEWHLTYDEVDILQEGIMEITCEGRVVRAYPGDIVFIPKGSKIRWSTPTWAKVLYVTFPAEWAA